MSGPTKLDGASGSAQKWSGIRLGRVIGIEIRLDWSLLLVFALVLLNLGAGVLPEWHPDWSQMLVWLVALLASVAFFTSVLVHELAHAVVARVYGVPAESITLYLFGGVSKLRGEVPSPHAECLVAAAGPITSLLIGAVATGIGVAVVQPALFETAAGDAGAFLGQLGPMETFLLWIGPINLLVGMFNMIPGFPLDGGRMLRAVLWWVTGDPDRATRWASAIGRLFALVMISVGVAMLFGVSIPVLGSGLSGVWLILVGFFLYQAAALSFVSVVLRERLRGVKVAELMLSSFERIGPELPVAEVVQHFLGTDQRCYPVTRDDRLLGVVTVADVHHAIREEGDRVPVSSLMTPADEVVTVSPDTQALDALELLAAHSIEQIVVVDAERVVGLFRPVDLVSWLRRHESAGPS